jgi:hypothetical protein
VHVAPYDRDPAAVPVLIAKPLEDPLSGGTAPAAGGFPTLPRSAV